MTAAVWYEDHANLVLLVSYMASSGYDASELARAVEKPWCYEDDYQSAVAEAQLPGASDYYRRPPS